MDPSHPYAAPFARLLHAGADREHTALALVLGQASARTALPDHDTLNAVFDEARRARFRDEPPLRFVFSPPKSKRRKKRTAPVDPRSFYDARITLEREVPTRAGDVHDFYNFMTWLAFPRSKRAVHARQYAALSRWIPPGARTIPGARTREQDALTLFDEGGVLLVGDAAALPREGPLPAAITAIAFGHALLEHFHLRDTPIAATAMVLQASLEDFPDGLDHALAERIADPARFLTPGLDALVMLGPGGDVSVVPRAPHCSDEPADRPGIAAP